MEALNIIKANIFVPIFKRTAKVCYADNMRILAIDYGSKRVGVALSDENQEYAFPKTVLTNDKKLMDSLEKIIIENDVSLIVVGDSRDYNGVPNKIMDKVVPFVEDIRLRLGLPVEMEFEFMTSQEAERLQGKNELLDASAAALILKSFIEKRLAKKEQNK